MDILLVNAQLKVLTRHASASPPLGLAYIASVLLDNGYDVSAIDFNISGFNPLRTKRVLERDNPRIVGISTHTKTYSNGLRIAEIAKQVVPEVKVVMGGPHATVMYKEVLREESIDVVVRGEGEYTMLELADYLIRNKGSLAETKGIAYKEDGTVKTTLERPFIENPDELPFPAVELFPMNFYLTTGQVLMSRGGCPFNCRFCAVNNIWKGRRRFRSPENVVKEILYIFNNFQPEAITFVDDTFTLNRDQVIRLCSLLKQISKSFPWHWLCATRVDLIDRELLQKMYEAGCSSITFGVEAGSQEILDSICKGITLEQVRNAVAMTIDIGMETNCAFMFPHPGDTEETIVVQKRFMKELLNMGAKVNINATVPYPGTYYYEHADELGINFLVDSWDEYEDGRLMITTRHLSERKLKYLVEDLVQDLGMEFSG